MTDAANAQSGAGGSQTVSNSAGSNGQDSKANAKPDEVKIEVKQQGILKPPADTKDDGKEMKGIGTLPKYEGINPFQPRTNHRTCWNRFKLVFFTITGIAIVRLLLWIVVMLLIYVFAFFGTCCHDRKKPLSGCRRVFFIWPIRFLARVLLFVSGFYWIPVSDKRVLKGTDKEARIIVANHVSLYDAMRIIYDTGCCAAAKNDIFKIPVLGTVLHSLQFIPVFRESADGRKASGKAVTDRVTTPGFPPLLIFPEGTTSNDQVLTMFKRGPFVPGLTVSPVCISYPNSHYDMYLGHAMGWSLYWSLCQFINFARWDYLKEYEPTDEEKHNPGLFAANVRKVMAEHLKVPTTEHCYADVALIGATKRAGLNRVDFVLDDVQRLYKLDADGIKALLKRFQELDKDHDGALTFDEFCTVAGVRRDSVYEDAAHRVFDLLDADHDGKIDFREFVVSVSVFSSQCSPLDSARVLWEICDLTGDGKLQKEELNNILTLAKSSRSALAAASPQTQPGSARKSLMWNFDTDEVFTALFPNGETEISYQQFIERLTPKPEVIKALLKRFLQRQLGPVNVPAKP